MTATKAEEQAQEFVEGEPELHAPEEEALEASGTESLLEQELDDQEILEEDLEEGLVEETLENLESTEEEAVATQPRTVVAEELEEEVSEEEIEAGLDEILRQRLGAEELEEEEEVAPKRALVGEEDELVEVLPPQPGEFVCRGCFLVRRKELLSDPARGLCRDCTA